MDSYIDIHVHPDPEFTLPMLMNALAAKLHRALVTLPTADIGLSLPNALAGPGRTTGALLRLHGKQAALASLEALHWRKGLVEYAQATAITPVPSVSEYCVVRRVQAKSNTERLRRRALKRHPDNPAQQLARLDSGTEQRLTLPFFTFKSQSTGQQFLLFIDQSTRFNEPQSGTFSKYGLSQHATVPWF